MFNRLKEEIIELAQKVIVYYMHFWANVREWSYTKTMIKVIIPLRNFIQIPKIKENSIGHFLKYRYHIPFLLTKAEELKFKK